MIAGALDGVRGLWNLLRDAARGWVRHDSPRAAAALAFYGLLSLAPTISVGLAIAETVVPAGSTRADVVEVARDRLGSRAGSAVEWLVERDSGRVSGAIGILTLIVAATAGFAQLQSALNDAWEVETDPDRPFVDFLRRRSLTFLMVIVIGALLLALTLFGALFNLLAAEMAELGMKSRTWMNVAEFFIALIPTTMLVGAIYKILPDAEITWRQVVVGAASTAILQGLARFGVRAYLSVAVLRGGSENLGEPLLALLLWAYFASMIFLFGAEITRAYVEHSTGAPIRPARGGRRTVHAQGSALASPGGREQM